MRAENARLLLHVIERVVQLGKFSPVEPYLAVQAIAAMGLRAVDWWSPESPHGMEKIATTYAEFALELRT
jgi:hypothetical protein